MAASINWSIMNLICIANASYLFRICFLLIETATRRVLWKKVFLEISQNSQESTSARVSFLIKLQASGFLRAPFYRTPLDNCSCTYPIYLFCNILESQKGYEKTDIKYWASITTFTKLMITNHFDICNFLPFLGLICQSNFCSIKLNHHISHTSNCLEEGMLSLFRRRYFTIDGRITSFYYFLPLFCFFLW